VLSCNWSDKQSLGRQSEVAIETIRAFLLSVVDPLDEVNQSADPSHGDVLADAVYVLLRGDPNLDVAVDGWSMFQVVQETTTSLKAVGIMTVLPSGELPMELEFSRESNATRYRLRMSLVDEGWYSLSESKRWKAVYLYATQGRDLDWPWAEPISGQLDDV
jgi:hypothetical protein